MTSTVLDDAYQRLQLLDNNHRKRTPSYSLETTGFAFDILRRYSSDAQAAAFQYELDRLQALNLIAWVREPETIHVTVASQAQALIAATRECGLSTGQGFFAPLFCGVGSAGRAHRLSSTSVSRLICAGWCRMTGCAR